VLYYHAIARPSLAPFFCTENSNKHLLRVGWRIFFFSCAVVSVFGFWQERVLGVTYLPYQLCRCVFFLVAVRNSFGLHRSVFWLWQEIVTGVTYLPTIPFVPLCQFFGCGGK
jgi:hypothetical protein